MNKERSSTTGPEKVLTDLFSRSITYLRLSLTDRCNLQCLYCVTEDENNGSMKKLQHHELLTYEEILRVVRVAVDMGITKLRLTGGEPLVRKDIMNFIRQLGTVEGLDDVRLTTNGVLLEKYARELYECGVTKVNISLDTFKPERFHEITGVNCFDKVWRGIQKAQDVGFSPLKINMVAMRNINDDELIDFARLSQKEKFQIRFIEFMPIGASSRWDSDTYISSDEIIDRLSKLDEMIPLQRGKADGPAKVYKLGTAAKGSLGFISPISHHFCDRCNRLRLTSEGRLRSCLLYDEETDILQILRNNGSDQEISDALLTAIRNKPQGHKMEERLKEAGNDCHGRMSRIGG